MGHMKLTLSPARPPLPREHGAWAMLLTPPIVAVVGAGPDPLGLMAVLGWVMAYSARGPLEVLLGEGPTGRAGMAQATPAEARRWLGVFGLAALLLLGPVVWVRPAVLWLLLGAAGVLGAVVELARRGQTRSLTAGLLASAGLMLGGPLYYLAAHGAVGREGWTLAAAGFAFFGGSVFRVKALAREKRSQRFGLLSVAVHAVVTGLMAATVPLLGVSWLVPVSLLPPLVWAVRGTVVARGGRAGNLGAIGMSEVWLTLLFGLLLMIGLAVPS